MCAGVHFDRKRLLPGNKVYVMYREICLGRINVNVLLCPFFADGWMKMRMMESLKGN